MSLRSRVAFFIAQAISTVSRNFNLGSGVTWAGEIALRIQPNLLHIISSQVDLIIMVTGTNGKTTTASMIAHIFENNNYSVIHNTTGANLKNGIMGTFITQHVKTKSRKKCVAIFETDEAEFANTVYILSPDVVVLLNLFRDQLDRYGEINILADKWIDSLKKLSKNTVLVINADDPLIYHIAGTIQKNVTFFGLTESKSRNLLSHSSDSVYCPSCSSKLHYHKIYLSHYGDWYCKSCKLERPKPDLSHAYSPLKGRYNKYNTLAAVLTAKNLGISNSGNSLVDFKPVFGRQESFTITGKKIQLFLSKNPTGFNESIRTVVSQPDVGAVILALNDRIPDGTDVSWIWDVDFEMLSSSNVHIICTGDRVWDMAVRMKYEGSVSNKDKSSNIKIEENLRKALTIGLDKTNKNKILYILPTYSAMLDIRKKLTGRKIL